jgi:hypothetical protein
MIARYRGTVKGRYLRGDAVFASPEIYEFQSTNLVLQNKIAYLLKRPVGRPPKGAATLPAFATKPDRGTSPGGWWRRSSGTRASFIRASALSSLIWRGQTCASSPSTTSGDGGGSRGSPFQMVEFAATRQMFQYILSLIARLTRQHDQEIGSDATGDDRSRVAPNWTKQRAASWRCPRRQKG